MMVMAQPEKLELNSSISAGNVVRQDKKKEEKTPDVNSSSIVANHKGPFAGYDDEDISMLRFIFDEELDDDFVVFRKGSVFLTRMGIRRLDAGECVLDSIILAVEAILQEPGSSQWFISAEYWETETETKHRRHLSNYAEFRQYSGIEKCDKIFIPMLDYGVGTGTGALGNHWFLMVVKLPSKEVEIWDSYLTLARKTRRVDLVYTMLETLDMIYSDEIGTSFEQGWSFSSFNIFHPDSVPQQPNEFDCGIFVIRFMEDFENACKVGENYESETERLRIAMKLLKHPDNQALNDVVEAMKEDRIYGTMLKRKRKRS